MLTDKADIELLMRATAYAKIPADQLKPEQPWKFEGKTAELLQMATEAINPVKSAQWRSDVVRRSDQPPTLWADQISAVKAAAARDGRSGSRYQQS